MLHLSRNDLMALFLARHALEPLRGTRLERMLAEIGNAEKRAWHPRE